MMALQGKQAGDLAVLYPRLGNRHAVVIVSGSDNGIGTEAVLGADPFSDSCNIAAMNRTGEHGETR